MKARTLACLGAVTLLGLAACSKLNSGQDQMSWARAALERNGRIEVVASDAQASTFTLRMKDTGELRVVPLNQVVAGPPPSTAPGEPASTPTPQEPKVVAAEAGQADKPPRSESASGAPPGHVLASGPGYTI